MLVFFGNLMGTPMRTTLHDQKGVHVLNKNVIESEDCMKIGHAGSRDVMAQRGSCFRLKIKGCSYTNQSRLDSLMCAMNHNEIQRREILGNICVIVHACRTRTHTHDAKAA